MKTPSPGIMAAGLIGLTGIILVSIGAPSSRKAPAPISETSEPAPPTSVSARGFSLASTSVDLPVDDAGVVGGQRRGDRRGRVGLEHHLARLEVQPAGVAVVLRRRAPRTLGDTVLDRVQKGPSWKVLKWSAA